MGLWQRVTRAAKTLSGGFSPASRSAITLAFFLFLAGVTFYQKAISAEPDIDERTWVDRSLRPLWGPPFYDDEYYYAVHHPAFSRIVYKSVLHSMGVYELNRPLVDYSHDLKWNILRGAYPPLDVEIALRLVNVAFLSGAVAIAYFIYKRLFANRLLALLGCLPLFFNATIKEVPPVYIGTDAMLLFWLAAFWAAWLWARDGSVARVIVLGIVGGLLVSTKVNGVFTLAGAGLYFVVTGRGWSGALRAAILVIVPAAVFVSLNPVYRAGDLAWATKVVKDVARLMFALKAKSTSHDWAQFSKAEVLRESFPYWIFYLPALAVIAVARREKWFGVTAVWAVFTVLPNWLLIYIPMMRYSAPISLAFLGLFDAAAIYLIVDTYRGASAETAKMPPAEDRR